MSEKRRPRATQRTVNITRETHAALRRMKKRTRRPIKYLIEEAVVLLERQAAEGGQ